MKNFTYNLPTEIIFGENTLNTLAVKIKQYTNNTILITYGGGSIKQIGLYDKVINILNENNISYVELGGIKPNPEISTAKKGVELIKEHKIEFILAVGGGSVLDNTKHMAMCANSDKDIWETLNDKKYLNSLTSIPKIGSIMTLAATGSENNSGGVITNPEINVKAGYAHPLAKPVFVYEDPTLLYSLPEYQRRAGVCDILSHLLEQYFGTHTDDMFADRLIEAQIKNLIDNYDLYINTNDYNAAANIFITSSFALNGLTSLGKANTDWLSHVLEHEVSAYTDLTHGIGLAIIHPEVINYYYQKDLELGQSLIKYENLAKHVFLLQGDDLAQKGVENISKLFYNISNVKKLSDVGIADFNGAQSAKKIIATGFKSSIIDLKEIDLASIYNTIK